MKEGGLQSVLLPELGGDTCFADMHAAFDALSPELQTFLCELTATHDMEPDRTGFIVFYSRIYRKM